MKTLNLIIAICFSLIATTSFAQINHAAINIIGSNGSELKVDNTNDNFSIKWQTASERNTARFELQISEDNEHFSNIKKVTAANTTSEPTNYQATFNHTIILADTIYCRVKTVFTDGSESYTSAILLNMNTGAVASK